MNTNLERPQIQNQDLFRNRKVPVMVTICGWLMMLESIIFFILGVYHFHLNNGPVLFSKLFAQWIRGDIPIVFSDFARFFQDLVNTATSAQLLTALIESGILFLLTILGIWTAIGFFRKWSIAWTTGLFVQAGALLTALVIYFIDRPFHIIIMMISGIFMVIYLNYVDVHTFFNLQQHDRRRGVR
jgi:hypothetical protein